MEQSKDELGHALLQMQQNLKRVSEEHAERVWLQACKNQLADKLKGNRTLKELSKDIIAFLVSHSEAQIGTLYTLEENAFNLQYSYGAKGQLTGSYKTGEGLIGSAAVKKSIQVLNKLPRTYFRIESSVGSEKPDSVAIIPALFNGEAVAVMELAKLGDFSPMQLKLLEHCSEAVGVSVNNLLAKHALEKMITLLEDKELDLQSRIGAISKSNASVEFDLDGTILSVNDIFLDLFGYSEKEVLGRHHSMFVEKNYSASKEYRQFWASLKKGAFHQAEFKRIRKNGEPVWLQGSYNPIMDAAGKPVRILKIANDVTQTKKQQQEIDTIMAAIYKANLAIEFDLNGIILNANANFLQLLGYKEGEVVGKHHRMFVEKEYAASKSYEEFWKSLGNGEYQSGEFKRVTKGGDVIWIKGNYNPIADAKGVPYKVLKMAVDITTTIEQSQQLALQSEELQTQQEELRQMNEELEEQAQILKQQQEELQATNEELEEQAQRLEIRNREVESARADIEQKTRQLEISSRYKSEFLANMSHELRTPLNSLLILSKDLADNKKKNLIPDQVESAEIINRSGQDLLGLINEVLDLSKIEAGKMVLNIERLSLKRFAGDLQRNFKHQAENKGLGYTVTLEKGLPEAIRTDSRRLDQVLKNLLSNALKFTEQGSVNVTFKMQGEDRISIAVQDTGIGVPDDKKAVIFEAFQQADGSTSRKYGGTGLGLSISRELIKLLGGDISLTSKINEGATFTVVIPLELASEELQVERTYKKAETAGKPPVAEKRNEFFNYQTIPDDRESIQEHDRVLLVIEDDTKFSKILLNQAHDKGFKCLVAATGEDGLALAEQFEPQAIILDMDLPGIDGNTVLMDLKANPLIRHIPVHIMSASERSVEPIKRGAIEYLTKPVNRKQLEDAFNRMESFIARKMKNLLVIEDDENARKATRKLIGNGDVKCLEAGTGKEAIRLFKENHIDCIVLDLGLPDMSGFDLIHQLEELKDGHVPPIIIYTGRELNREENSELEKYAESIIIKGVKSEERLLDETALFLHRTISSLPELKQKLITGLYDKESIFVDKKILVVDDDMRNVFALSKVLKERGVQIHKAENGVIALKILDEEPNIDLVLMDIMMPEMDGYEAMRRIRSQIKFRKLPVIALTAKAMKDDKQKCIDAGANDYVAKPVELERLLSLIRVWLSK
jgi:PAS domain S-box-containing protein